MAFVAILGDGRIGDEAEEAELGWRAGVASES